MTRQERIQALIRLGEQLKQPDARLHAVMRRSYVNNPWFTIENIQTALGGITRQFLEASKLQAWLASYDIPDETNPKSIGIIMAGNIPLVGFHDLLCTFVAGHHAKIKLSDKDKYLLPYLITLLNNINLATQPYFEIVERLKIFDAVIATGSNNTARYFYAYFGKHPHIIRKNRNGIAILTGQETKAELVELGKDIFTYFGLGCRSVSKIYVPTGYDFQLLLAALHEYRELIHHNKYKNNFDYNYTLLILNNIPHHSTGCILLTEATALPSRIAQLHYEYYDNSDTLLKHLAQKNSAIQCIVSQQPIATLKTFRFGEAQQPALGDYADGVDTLAFLLGVF